MLPIFINKVLLACASTYFFETQPMITCSMQESQELSSQAVVTVGTFCRVLNTWMVVLSKSGFHGPSYRPVLILREAIAS